MLNKQVVKQAPKQLISEQTETVQSSPKAASPATISFNNYSSLSVPPSVSTPKLTIVNFWATWCPPCRKEIPHFIQLSKKYPDVQIIGISLDDSPVPVSDFIVDKKMNYPVYMMHEHFFDYFGQVNSIPTTFILDRNNKIIKQSKGYRNQDYFESIISQNN